MRTRKTLTTLVAGACVNSRATNIVCCFCDFGNSEIHRGHVTALGPQTRNLMSCIQQRQQQKQKQKSVADSRNTHANNYTYVTQTWFWRHEGLCL